MKITKPDVIVFRTPSYSLCVLQKVPDVPDFKEFKWNSDIWWRPTNVNTGLPRLIIDNRINLDTDSSKIVRMQLGENAYIESLGPTKILNLNDTSVWKWFN